MATAKKSASKSGNPARRASAAAGSTPPEPAVLAPTPASAWQASTGTVEDVLLPSGNVARVKRVGPEVFMAQGLIPDELTAIVEKSIKSKKGLPPEKSKEMATDPKQIGAMLEMMDRTLCYAVVAPSVSMPPACSVCEQYDKETVAAHHDEARDDYHPYTEAERDPNVLYADRVDFDDKAFIMNFCLGGTRDLAQFRREFGASLGSLAAV